MSQPIPHSKHTVSGHYVNAFLQGAERLTLDRTEALRQAQLSPEMVASSQLRVTAGQLASVVRFVWEKGNNELLGLTRSGIPFGTFELFAEHTVHCENLGEVYDYLCRFYNLTSDDIQLEMKEIDGLVRLELRLCQSEADRCHCLYELLFLIWHRFPSWLVGKTIPLKGIEFNVDSQPHSGEFRLMYPCPITFGQRVDCMIIEKEALNLPVNQTPSGLQRYLKTIPLNWFRQQIYSDQVTRQVVDLLKKADTPEVRSMEATALLLNTTTRTLRRKLLDEGTSFQQIADSLRRDEAIHLLNQRTVSISRISELLGFSDPAAFSRAFKGWTGVTPSTYRKT
jgi:AraC-like DNA-binding protein